MSYSNQTQNTTQTTQNSSTNSNLENIEQQVFQQNRLPQNPDVKIIECPLSQASSFSENFGTWRNDFRDPIFIPKGSEIRVQSCFVESRGISGDILVFDSQNTLTSRNDNVEHLYEFYVNNTGFNDMILQYDLKARGLSTPERDSGHNYKKYQLERYVNIWAREPYFVGGNNLINRVIRTSVDNYIEVSTNRDDELPAIESLYRIAPREDPFVSGRYLTSNTSTDNQISLSLGTNGCFIYGNATHSEGDMSFYKYEDSSDKGYIIIDFGVDKSAYKHYIAPQKNQEESYVSNDSKFYATDNFSYGDCIKFSMGAEYTVEDEGASTDYHRTEHLRDVNNLRGGFLYIGERIDLKDPSFSTEYNDILTKFFFQASVNAGALRRYELFIQGKYIATTTLNYFYGETSITKRFFNREAIATTTSDLWSLGQEMNYSHTDVSNGTDSLYWEIAKTPFYSYTNGEQADNDVYIGFNNGSTYEGSTQPYLLSAENIYTIPTNKQFTLYQYLPNKDDRIKKIRQGLINENQDNDTVAPVYKQNNTTLTYLSGGNHTSIKTYNITSLTTTTSPDTKSEITITSSDVKNFFSAINLNDVCMFDYQPSSDISTTPSTVGEMGIFLGGFVSATETTITIEVLRNVDENGLVASPTTISFFMNTSLKTFLDNSILPQYSQGFTEMSKYLNIELNESNVFQSVKQPEYKFQISNFEKGIHLNKPSGFYGNLDSNKDFYNTNIPKLFNEFGQNKLEEYNQGCQNFIGEERVINTNSFFNDRQNNGIYNYNLRGLTQLLTHTPKNLPTPSTTHDNYFPFSPFTDTSHRVFKYVPHIQSFSYKTPKPYMSPSDLSNDYTRETHKATGVIDYDNNKEYEDTLKSGIMRNKFVIPVFSSNYTGNTFDTTTGEMNPDLTEGKNTGGYMPNSFRAIGKMDESLLVSTNVKTTDNYYYLYFRNQHTPVRNYDPYDPTRTTLPVVKNKAINNEDPNNQTKAKMWDGSLVSQVNGKFEEQPFPNTTVSYPITYTTTQKDTKGNIITQNQGISQFCGAVNGITLNFNSQLSLFEYSFLHTPFSTQFDKDTNTGGDTAIGIHYPTLQYVDNIEQISGVKMLNWTKPNYRIGMFRQNEISTFKPPVYENGLNPFTDRDPVGTRFMNKLGYTTTTLSNNESNTTIFDDSDIGTTGSDIDGASAIINSKVSVENEPNYQSNLLTGSSTKPEYNNQFLGDRIFYPYGIDQNTEGFSKDNADIRYDFALPKFSSVGGIRITNHNTGCGLPSTINSFIYTDPNTIPITHNPDFQKYSGYIIQSDSSVIRADNLPSKYDNGYFLLQSSLAADSSNFYLGKQGQGSNIISTILKTYISGDFIISF